jgi:hypothetical protein
MEAQVEAPRISKQSAYEGTKAIGPTHRRLYLQEDNPGTHIC